MVANVFSNTFLVVIIIAPIILSKKSFINNKLH